MDVGREQFCQLRFRVLGAVKQVNGGIGLTVRVAVREPQPLASETHVLALEEIENLSEDRTVLMDVQRGGESTSAIVRQLLTLAVERGASDIHL